MIAAASALASGCAASERTADSSGVSSNDAREAGSTGHAPEPEGDAGGFQGPEAGSDATATGGHPDGGRDAASSPDAGSPGPWASIGFGITGTDTGVGDNILVVYGGYTATDHDSQGWATHLWSARLAALGVGHLYAARGPADAGYKGREIGNSALAARLAAQAGPAGSIIVVAHSSGAFVADELFTFAAPAVLAKLAYFNLDGGSWALTDALVGAMKGVTFCNAHDSVAGYSHNAQAIDNLHAQFAASHLFTVDADGSGCNAGATWCLHDTLIINHPHDPSTFDLADDYTDFTSGRQIVTSYIDEAVSAGIL